MDKVIIREAKESDFPFIYSTWLKGLRFGNDSFAMMEQGSYFKNYHRYLEHVLNLPSTIIMVAALQEDPDTILGYSVLGNNGTIHYVHVKQAFRKFGIAKQLCPQDIRRVTHVTKVGWSILKAKFPNAIYDPWEEQ